MQKSSETPTVDVIIPAYNAEKYLFETIKSVALQTYPVTTIYIVDDGSKDGTQNEIIRARTHFPRVKIESIIVKNGGVSRARNIGINLCKSDWIGMVDADDIWEPHKIAHQLLVAKKDSRTGVVYCDYGVINEAGALREYDTNLRLRPVHVENLPQFLIQNGNRISGSASAVLVKKDLLQANLFDETLGFGEDWDVWIRLAKVTKFDFCDEILVHIRRHSTNASNDDYALFRGELRILDKHKELLKERKLCTIYRFISMHSFKNYLIHGKEYRALLKKLDVNFVSAYFLLFIFFLHKLKLHYVDRYI